MSVMVYLLWVCLYMSVMGLSIHVCYGSAYTCMSVMGMPIHVYLLWVCLYMYTCYGSVYTCMPLKIKGYSYKNKHIQNHKGTPFAFILPYIKIFVLVNPQVYTSKSTISKCFQGVPLHLFHVS